MITGRQIRMARVALRWRVDDLSKKSGVSWARIQQLERLDLVPTSGADKVAALEAVFNENNIFFVDSTDEFYETIKIKKN